MLRRWCPSARSERRGGENCQARQWFVRPSTDPRTGAALGHLGCAACSDSRDAGRPIRCPGPLTAGAADRCRPPPSTSCPCPAWFFRLSGPFFRRRETAVEKRFAPIELPVLVQFRQECAPNGEPDPLPFPVSKPPPAGGR